MFLRLTAALLILLLPLCADSALKTTERYESNHAESDIKILKSIIARRPEDLKTLKRLINLTFNTEQFEEAERYCEQYLSIEQNSEVAYVKIIAAASLGKFKSAADQVDPFIRQYKNELGSRDVMLLRYKEALYRKSVVSRGQPSGGQKASWGEDSLIKTAIHRDSLFAGYKFADYEHTIFKVSGNQLSDAENYPAYLSGIPFSSISFISLSDDGREVLVSSRSRDKSSIYIRRYIPGKKRWSSWETPDELNPGRWNHYANYIDNNTVLFSSSDDEDYDLYISMRDKDGEWSEARKLPGVNTPLDEISASLHPDGETLYFSSNGYEGMGGYDIYGAKLMRKGDSYEVTGVRNVSSANTCRNEKYPVFINSSGSVAYFNFRKGSGSNVYLCGELPYKPAPVFFYDAEVIDDSTGLPVNGATAEYKSAGTDFAISRPVYSDGFTGATLRRNRKYSLTINADGYEPQVKEISYTGTGDRITENIRLKKKSVKEPAPVYTVLVTTLKLYNCDDAKARPVLNLLEEKTGLQGDGTRRSKNILSFTACGDKDCALRDGRTVQADYVVFGSLSAKKESGMKTLGETGEDQYLAKKVTGIVYTLELKMINVSSGTVSVSFQKNTSNPDVLKKITNEFIRKTAMEFR